MGKSSKAQMDTMLNLLKWFAFAGILIAVVMIAFYFWHIRGPISHNQNDWASLGTFFSGIFSFLGAIGTVGVMLLGIKQFKIQQEQIASQTERQDTFEKKQDYKWEKENEMLRFQKYQMHFNQFDNLLVNIEKEHSISFKNRAGLYFEIFPSNSFENCSFLPEMSNSAFSNTESNLIWLQKKIEEYNQTPNAKNFREVNYAIKSLTEMLDVSFEDTAQNKILDLDSKNYLPHIISTIDLMNKIRSFSGLKLNKEYDLLDFNLRFFNNKVMHYDSGLYKSGHSGNFLNLIVLISEAIYHNPTEHPALYAITSKIYSSKEINLNENFYRQAKFDELKKAIIESQLELTEVEVLIEHLDKYLND
ncbi:hypothetical protein LMH66_19350 [Shewanella sp. 10N.7]|uniref:hypothetical protein n=1 Tax=Shewanella sp. 10N.7 TaxID=2885093 RepID=UPI001E5D9EE4|nr:hypothetical protein [Shewanella sp. 10N.7]MCC4834804.1 hypothetical protein [Shewanella sp. 10N.7]